MSGSHRFSLFFIIYSFIFFAEGNLNAADGKMVYSKNCVSCHATEGEGNDKIAALFKIDQAKLSLVGNEAKSKSDADLVKIVLDGNGKMKGLKDKLSQEEAAAVVKYVRSLQK